MENLHTHTWRCGHATGDVEDYLKAAAEQKCFTLGFSDHTPLPDGRWSHIRMNLSQLPGYISAVNRAKENSSFQAVYLGLECEWDSVFRNFYDNEILPAGDFDFLAGAVHFFPWHGEWLYIEDATTPAHLVAYADQAVRTISSGYFSFFVHPDAFLAGFRRWDENARACTRDILSAAVEYNITLEINGNGYRKSMEKGFTADDVFYPYEEFWHMAAEKNIPALCSSDAHKPEDVCASLPECFTLAETCGVRIINAADITTPVSTSSLHKSR